MTGIARQSVRGAYHLEDIKFPRDGRSWAQRLTVPFGTRLVSVEIWEDWEGQKHHHLCRPEDDTKAGPHGAAALGLLCARAASAEYGGLTKRQAAQVTREYLDALATGEVPPRLRAAVQAPTLMDTPREDEMPANYVHHLTLSFAEERAIWLEFVPELGGLLGAMPERIGALDVYLGAVPNCYGAVVLTVTLRDKSLSGPQWSWCDAVCIQTPRGDLADRVTGARARIAGLRRQRATVARTRPRVGREGQNVVSFRWYKKLFAEEGL